MKKKLIGLAFSLSILLFSIYVLVTSPSPIKKDVSLAGGVEFYIPKNQTLNLTEFKNAIIKETDQYYIIDVPYEEANKIKSKYNVSYREFKPTVASNFYKSLISAFIFSFLAVGVSLFFFFKNPLIPALTILALVSNVIDTLAFLNLIGFKFSIASLASLFMFVGYSVDTNILLSEKVLEEGNYKEALITGLSLTLTTIIALIVILLFSQNEILKSMALVLLVGLTFDIINTWIQNGSLLLLLNKEQNKKNQ
ncbi:NEQ437 [Nanoarchaeum equitans Kin4-M]|uniref:Protein-export membrane protein SecF n=1 Tax=Nanoarchaeum equitans (strain Kin4-M) TaxID=228908 RepID=Q74M76_NANEQ|nr:NEQ437 [Nanoarchaeum equitans Kin4-M]